VEKRIELKVDSPDIDLKNLPRLLAYKSIGDQAYDYTLHGTRTAALARLVGRELKLGCDEIELLATAAMTHDVGKVFLPTEIVLNPGMLTDEEYVRIKKHASLGAEFLSRNNCRPEVVDAALHHHERFDGTGYPDQLKGENIMLSTRIISVVDAFDAMLSNDRDHRVMHKNLEDAVAEIDKNSGTQFDPKVVEAFKKALKRRSITK